jgi:hypothetical protein
VLAVNLPAKITCDRSMQQTRLDTVVYALLADEGRALAW